MSAAVEWVVAGLVLAGSLLTAVAALGVARMPDLFTRMQAATKAGTFGVSCLFLAVALSFGTLDVTVRALLVIVFVLTTGPVAAHVLARAAYRSGIPLWPGTVRDELRDALRRGVVD